MNDLEIRIDKIHMIGGDENQKTDIIVNDIINFTQSYKETLIVH